MRIWQQRAEREGSSKRETERESGGAWKPQLHRQTLQLSITLTVASSDALPPPLLPHAALIRHVGLSKSVTQCTRAELTDNCFSALVRCRPRCELYSVMHMDVDVNVNVSVCVHVDIFRVHSSVHSHIHFATYSIFYAALRRFCGRSAAQSRAAATELGSEFSCSCLDSVDNNFYALIPSTAGAAQK